MALKAELISRDVETRERLNRERLDAQVAQVQRARAVTRLSPAAIVQYAIESMAGTGFNRHLQYLEHVHQHTKQFRQFIVETDRADIQSRHFIGIPKGMSQKPVAGEAIPKFEDKIAFSDTFNTATLEPCCYSFYYSAYLFQVHSLSLYVQRCEHPQSLMSIIITKQKEK